MYTAKKRLISLKLVILMLLTMLPLPAARAADWTTVLHGNGGLTADGSDQISVTPDIPGTPTDLRLYYGAFHKDDAALVSYNTAANGSGQTVFMNFSGAVYAQWAPAADGSIVLHASGDGDSWEGQVWKILSGDDTAGFSLSDPCGLTMPKLSFKGWSLDGETVLNTLPEGDSRGIRHLQAVWGPFTVICDFSAYGMGAVQKKLTGSTVFLPDENPYPYNKVCVGWNTRPNGTGQWYRPGEQLQVTEDMTLYAIVADIPDDGLCVRLEREEPGPDGWYDLLTGSSLTEDFDNSVRLTLPEKEGYWYHNGYGYAPGSTVTLENRAILSPSVEYDHILAHRNGGVYPGGADVRVVSMVVSYSDMTRFPGSRDFIARPGGAALTGWSGSAQSQPGETVYGPDSMQSIPGYNGPDLLYARWGEAVGVTVLLQTGLNTLVQYAETGSRIDLPYPTWSGYIFSGWSDGETIWPGAGSYTVPSADVVLTAVWRQEATLIVDGVSYTASESYDYLSSAGWQYDGYSSTLHLNGYNGGAIILPQSTTVSVEGASRVTGAAGQAGITCVGALTIEDSSAGGTTIISGGAGAAAVSAASVTLTENPFRLGSLELLGGAGAGAVETEGDVYLSHGNCLLLGGGVSAIFAAQVTLAPGGNWLAGEGENALDAVEEYADEVCLLSAPMYVELTLHGNGGKVGGQNTCVELAERGKVFSFHVLDPWRAGYMFLGWNTAADGSGERYEADAQLRVQDELTLYAQWMKSPGAGKILLNPGAGNTVEGQPQLEIALPEDGLVTLPAAELSDDGQISLGWSCVSTDGKTRSFPAGPEVDLSGLSAGAVLAPVTMNSSAKALWLCIDKGDWTLETTFGGSGFYSIPDDYMGPEISGWNTAADGSGESFTVFGFYQFPADQNVVFFYARFAAAVTYTTVMDNEWLPGRVTDFTGTSHYVSCWRDKDWTNLWAADEYCGLPAGTTLYAAGTGSETLYIVLDSNGAAASEPLLSAKTEWEIDSSGRTLSVLHTGQTGFSRQGYRLAGWNTRADGTGKAYPADYSVVVAVDGKEDKLVVGSLPERLYAQWEKLPAEQIPVPKDMRQTEDAVILCGIYSAGGKLLDLIPVSADMETVDLMTAPAEGSFYRFFCADSTWQPLLEKEEGAL